jgi:hypothetical protein
MLESLVIQAPPPQRVLVQAVVEVAEVVLAQVMVVKVVTEELVFLKSPGRVSSPHYDDMVTFGHFWTAGSQRIA